MRKLENKELEKISGGSWFEGFCIGAGVVSIIAPNPVAIGVTAGCLIADFYGAL